jgi:hypothetical protein
MILQSATQKLLEGDIFGFIIEIFTVNGAVPTPILALLVFGPIGVGYYMTQRSAVIPLIMFVLIGGVTVAEFPAGIQQGVVAGFAILTAAIGYALLQRVRVR